MRQLARYPLVLFFVLAFVLTWVVWVPRAAGVPVGVVGQLWTWIPAIAAILAAALTGGPGGVLIAALLHAIDEPVRGVADRGRGGGSAAAGAGPGGQVAAGRGGSGGVRSDLTRQPVDQDVTALRS